MTKAQQALKPQHEQCKLERKTKSREQKDAENDRENWVIFKDVHEPAETDRKLKRKRLKLACP